MLLQNGNRIIARYYKLKEIDTEKSIIINFIGEEIIQTP